MKNFVKVVQGMFLKAAVPSVESDQIISSEGRANHTQVQTPVWDCAEGLDEARVLSSGSCKPQLK